MPILCFLAIFLFSAAPGPATTLERLDLPQLVQRAQTIFIGTCLSVDEATQEGRPYTRIRFAVSRTLKGEHLSQRTVHLPGGSQNGQSIRYIGMPRVDPNEEIVFFLTQADALGHPWPVGLAQGKFTVLRQANSAWVSRDLHGATLLGAAKGTRPLDGMPLEDFMRQVLDLRGGPSDATR